MNSLPPMVDLPSIDPDLARAIILLLPLVGVGLVILLLGITRRRAVGAFLGFMWNLPTLFLTNVLALKLGWWEFEVDDLLLCGVPVDVMLGWAVFWGGFLFLALSRLNLLLIMAWAILLDLALMPALAPLIQLGDSWLLGEAVVVVTCLMPGLLLAKLTADDRGVGVRATLQAIATGGWILFLLPATVLTYTGGNFFSILAWESWQKLVFFDTMLIPILLGLVGNHEFACIGRGTPIPFDPPKRLVSTGPYAYLANPMQVSIVLTLTTMAVAYTSLPLLGAALIAVIYCVGFAKWHQQSDIAIRFGHDWYEYKRNVRDWIPRWTPYVKRPAEVYFAKTCGICQDAERWVRKLQPTGLLFRCAELHPTRDLTRATYRHADGTEEEGIVAIARCLEHVNFAYAFVGFCMRLPVISHVLQIALDGSGERLDRCTRPRASNMK